MTAHRRSRQELLLARFVRYRQQWRERATGVVWEVQSVHRQDCVVVLREVRSDGHGTVRSVGFMTLRRDYRWRSTVPTRAEVLR